MHDGRNSDLVSSGLYIDDGVNTLMRNNDTYKYRKPFKLYMNPMEVIKKYSVE